jgi:hypothetical protein
MLMVVRAVIENKPKGTDWLGPKGTGSRMRGGKRLLTQISERPPAF